MTDSFRFSSLKWPDLVSDMPTEIFIKFLPDHTPFVWREPGRYEKPTHTYQGRQIVAVGLPEAPSPRNFNHPWTYQTRIASWAISLDNTELLLYHQLYFERWTWRTGSPVDLAAFQELDQAVNRRGRPEFPRHLKITWVQ